MQDIHVNVYIHAPVERVFEAVTNHEVFISSEDGTRTTITRPGTTERNGAGCLRDVRAGRGIRLVEEITAFERPSSYDYQIIETTLPLRHHGGRLRFLPRGEGTEIDWRSRFEVTVPIVGRALEPLAAQTLTATFTAMLIAAKTRLESA